MPHDFQDGVPSLPGNEMRGVSGTFERDSKFVTTLKHTPVWGQRASRVIISPGIESNNETPMVRPLLGPELLSFGDQQAFTHNRTRQGKKRRRDVIKYRDRSRRRKRKNRFSSINK